MGDREGLLFQLFWQRLRSCRSGACEIRFSLWGIRKSRASDFCSWWCSLSISLLNLFHP